MHPANALPQYSKLEKMTRKKRKSSKKRNSSLIFFALFFTVAFLTVILLEYIDFRNGKKSLIFTRIIPLETTDHKTDRFNENFLRILKKNNIECSYHQDDKKQFHFSLEIDESRFKGLVGRIEKLTAELKGKMVLAEVQGMSGKSIMLYKVTLAKNVSHWILITRLKKITEKPAEAQPKVEEKKAKPIPEKTSPPSPRVSTFHGTPRIAIIIDDVGNYDIGALELKKLGIPITASVLPDSPHAAEEARWLEEYGLRSMIHLPMQPKNGNGQTYDRSRTVTLNSTDAEIRQLIKRAKQVVPYARGVNNHQGSLATTDTRLMNRTLKIIKEEGLFFVDSRTIGNSVAFAVAKQLGIKTAYKSLFLDHVKGYDHAVERLKKLVEIALQGGKAIAIGHPNQSTIDAIKDTIPYIRSRGIDIVYVAELLE
jgi:polysaccharide deacetylase 2 family uncharacterized protein YibQ